MIIQKKYYMVFLLLSMSSLSYGMEFFADLIARDPLALQVARRKAEIRKTTQEINAACKVASRSNGNYELTECRGPIRVVVPTEKEVELPKPKL